MKTISIPKGDMHKKLRFIATARLKKSDIDPHMQKIYISEEWIAATDRKRLHLTQNECHFDPGYYDVVKNTTKEVILVPASEEIQGRVYPANIAHVLQSVGNDKIELPPHNPDVPGEAIFRIYHDTEVFLNPQYIQDALLMADAGLSFRYHQLDKLQPTAIENCESKAIIMPCTREV